MSTNLTLWSSVESNALTTTSIANQLDIRGTAVMGIYLKLDDDL